MPRTRHGGPARSQALRRRGAASSGPSRPPVTDEPGSPAKALAAEGADGDARLIAAAQAVLQVTDAPGSSRGKYALDAASPSGQAPA